MKPSELLADPAKWCKGAVCRDSDVIVCGDIQEAASWCLAGAIQKCSATPMADTVKVKDAIIARYPGSKGVLGAFNDNKRTTHADVLAVLKDAGL